MMMVLLLEKAVVDGVPSQEDGDLRCLVQVEGGEVVSAS